MRNSSRISIILIEEESFFSLKQQYISDGTCTYYKGNIFWIFFFFNLERHINKNIGKQNIDAVRHVLFSEFNFIFFSISHKRNLDKSLQLIIKGDSDIFFRFNESVYILLQFLCS